MVNLHLLVKYVLDDSFVCADGHEFVITRKIFKVTCCMCHPVSKMKWLNWSQICTQYYLTHSLKHERHAPMREQRCFWLWNHWINLTVWNCKTWCLWWIWKRETPHKDCHNSILVLISLQKLDLRSEEWSECNATGLKKTLCDVVKSSLLWNNTKPFVPFVMMKPEHDSVIAPCFSFLKYELNKNIWKDGQDFQSDYIIFFLKMGIYYLVS